MNQMKNSWPYAKKDLPAPLNLSSIAINLEFFASSNGKLETLKMPETSPNEPFSRCMTACHAFDRGTVFRLGSLRSPAVKESTFYAKPVLDDEFMNNWPRNRNRTEKPTLKNCSHNRRMSMPSGIGFAPTWMSVPLRSSGCEFKRISIYPRSPKSQP